MRKVKITKADKRKVWDTYGSKINKKIDINTYRCPKCGKHMRYQKADLDKNDSIRKGHYKYDIIICDDCNMIARVEKKGGVMVLITIPADAYTRKLRAEAHFYFNILVKEGIFLTTEESYKWLSDKLYFGCNAFGIKHIGEMDSEFCKRTIQQSLICIQDNSGRIKEKIQIFKNGFVSCNQNLIEIINKINSSIR